MRTAALAALFLALVGPQAGAGDPWFRNVSREVGLAGVRAKDCVFADLDGDGYWDLCLDRERLYLSEKGERFEAHEDHGLPFPVIKRIPLDENFEPDLESAKEGPYVPDYVYFADLDNDGDQDAIRGVHAWWFAIRTAEEGWYPVKECDPGVRSEVWLNDGRGRFSKAPGSAYSDLPGPAMALAIVDVDLDGNLDLYEGREYRRYGVLYGCGIDRLFRGKGDGTFEDVTEAAGLLTVPAPGGPRSSRPSYGVTHADVNNDGWPDLLQLSYGRQWNYLWLNRGDGTFRDFGVESGFAGDEITDGRYPAWNRRDPEQPFRSNGNTFDCAVGDYDNDGDLDLFLGEIQHAWAGEASDPPSVLENLGEEAGWRFRRHPVQTFLPEREFRGGDPRNRNLGDLHAAWLDVDNDTRLDLLIGSGDYPDGQFLRLYHQQEDGSFADATAAAGFDWEGCGDLSIGDFDRDGDVDILAGRSFMRLNQAHRDKYMNKISVNEVGLFRNEIANRSGNHWFNVRLVGEHANRSGIGARITLTAGGVTQIREIRSGSGLSNHQDPPEACFGLGKATKVARLVVRWPNGELSEQSFENLPADRFAVVTQDRDRPKLTRGR